MIKSKAKKNIQISLPATGDDEWHAVKDSITTGWLTQGPKVAEFEKAFAEKHKVKNALATTSCTTGLHLILASLEIGPGDEVLVPAFTWVATASVIVYCGATPVFVDIDPKTFNINPSEISKKVTKKTKAIIVVHLFGLCSDMDEIKNILPKNIKIIEDCACASGAIYKGKYAGTLGDAGAFSFHPRKSITTGEGGMITTDNDSIAEIANILRNHGASISEEQRHIGSKPYMLPDFNLLGFNYRMTDLQGSIGLVQLAKLDSFIDERHKSAVNYINELSKIDWLRMPSLPDDGIHAWQAFVTYVNPDIAPYSRNHIMEILHDRGISTRPGTHAVHMLGYYKNRFNIDQNNYPGARDANNNSMAIPLHNKMTNEDYSYVINELKAIK